MKMVKQDYISKEECDMHRQAVSFLGCKEPLCKTVGYCPHKDEK